MVIGLDNITLAWWTRLFLNKKLTFDDIFASVPSTLIETKYSRMDQVKLFKGCLPQILLGPLLCTLFHNDVSVVAFAFALLFLVLIKLQKIHLLISLKEDLKSHGQKKISKATSN